MIQSESKQPIGKKRVKTISETRISKALFIVSSLTKLINPIELLDKHTLHEALSQADFAAQTLTQLQKDFDRAQIDIQFVTTDLLFQIETAIQKLPQIQLQQLLYLIDVPEIDWDLQSGQSYHQKLAEVILHREALKVFLRRKFA